MCYKLLSIEEMEETAEVETSYKSSMLTSGADDLKFRLQTLFFFIFFYFFAAKE